MDMDNVGDSQALIISQESAHQTTTGQTTTGLIPSSSQPPPNETIEAPIDVTADNIEALAETGNSRRRSKVWDHFTRLKVNREDKAQCHYCKKFLGGKSTNGTKHLLHHMDTCIHKKLHENKTNKGQTFLMPKGQGKKDLGIGTYNAENSRKELASAIIMHEYPLSIVDHVYFRRFLSSLQPLFQVPCRNTIKKEILKVYEFERSETSKLFDSLQSRVAITSGMWTSGNQKKGYMAITAHYIDGSWNLQSRILR